MLFGSALLALLTSVVVASPPIPTEDPFYTPPAGFESSALGTVLRSRTIQPAFFGLLPQINLKQTYQLLYRTQSINGSAIADVTTVFVPQNAATDRFVSFQTAYDSSDPSCEPSYSYQLGANQSDGIAAAEQLIAQAYLGKNLIVSAPDYEGPEAAWTAGRLSGTGVLDGIRAVINFGQTLGLKKNPMVVGQGYSGGAIATAWAAALQHNYAPELNIKGWSAGGTPANLTGTAQYLDDQAFSGFLVAAVAGLTKPTAYGAQLENFVNSIATAKGRAAFLYGRNNCGIECVFTYPYQSIESTEYQSLGSRLYYEPTIRAVLEQNVLGVHRNETPVVPMYVYNARPDEIIPYANASTMVDSWCEYGATVDFVTYEAGGHLTTELVGFPGAFQFAQNAFAGTLSNKGGCTRTYSFNSTLDPLALGLDLEPLLLELLGLLVHAGQEDSNIKHNVTNLIVTR